MPFFISDKYDKQHCILQAFEHFGALQVVRRGSETQLKVAKMLCYRAKLWRLQLLLVYVCAQCWDLLILYIVQNEMK